MSETNQPMGVSVEFAFSVQDSPHDVKIKWVGLHVLVPTAVFVLGMPPEAAEQLAQTLPPALHDIAQQARHNSTGGLTIAPADSLTILNKRNRNG